MYLDPFSFAVGVGTGIVIFCLAWTVFKLYKNPTEPLIEENPMVYTYKETIETREPKLKEKNKEKEHSEEWYTLRSMAMDYIENDRRVDKIIEDTNCTSVSEFIDAFSEYLGTIARNYTDQRSDWKGNVFKNYSDPELYEVIRDHVEDFIIKRKKYTDMISIKIMDNSINYQQDKIHKRPVIVDNYAKKPVQQQHQKEETVDIFKKSGFFDDDGFGGF